MSRRGYLQRQGEALKRREAEVGRLWDAAHQESVAARSRLVRAQNLERDLSRRESDLAMAELELQARQAALSLEELKRPVPRLSVNTEANGVRRFGQLLAYALEETDNVDEALVAAELAYDSEQRTGEIAL
jgi:hypothetical protein